MEWSMEGTYIKGGWCGKEKEKREKSILKDKQREKKVTSNCKKFNREKCI